MTPRPHPYLQPVFPADHRCALYALANLLNHGGFLLFSTADGMTTHEEETEFLRRWAESTEGAQANSLLFHAGIYGHGRLHLKDIKALEPGVGFYHALLLDYRKPGAEHAHTVGVLWGNSRDCLFCDPQKKEPVLASKAAMFSVLEVVGVRYLTMLEGESELPILLEHSEVSHLMEGDAPKSLLLS